MEDKRARLLSKTRDPDRERKFDYEAERKLREMSPDAEGWMRFRVASRLLPYARGQARDYIESVVQAALEIPVMKKELEGKKIEVGLRHDGSMVDAEVIGPLDEGRYALLITEANLRLKIIEVTVRELLRAFHQEWNEEKLEEEVKRIMEIARVSVKGW
jgi:hypothetical protein